MMSVCTMSEVCGSLNGAGIATIATINLDMPGKPTNIVT